MLHESVLALTDPCMIFQGLAITSQDNLFYNSIKPKTKIVRPIISRVFFVALFENWKNVCLLPITWNSSGLPRLLIYNYSRSCNNISALFHYSGVNPTRSHRLTCTQLQQQTVPIQSRLRAYHSWSIMVFHLRAPRASRPMIGVKNRNEEGNKYL